MKPKAGYNQKLYSDNYEKINWKKKNEPEEQSHKKRKDRSN